jgi:choline dehydrogenase-like flavoprotein
MRSTVIKELKPGPEFSDRAGLEEDLRRRLMLIYHPVGTCRMGSGDDAVLDSELRVRGLEGLRVVDASVFPIIPGGNTNAPTIMVAEKASDLIRGRAPLRRATATAV